MPPFDLNSKEALDYVNDIVTDVVTVSQRNLYENNSPLILVKNRPILNTAIKLAARTVEYHDIEANDVSNIKKFAHICFWMLRLQPISYLTDVAARGAVGTTLAPIFGRRAIGDTINYHAPVNTEASFLTFLVLSANHVTPDESVGEKISSVLQTEYIQQVITSLRYHNYSSRSMAMFLESIFIERII